MHDSNVVLLDYLVTVDMCSLNKALKFALNCVALVMSIIQSTKNIECLKDQKTTMMLKNKGQSESTMTSRVGACERHFC